MFSHLILGRYVLRYHQRQKVYVPDSLEIILIKQWCFLMLSHCRNLITESVNSLKLDLSGKEFNPILQNSGKGEGFQSLTIIPLNFTFFISTDIIYKNKHTKLAAEVLHII